jgi:hypothetical protein
LLAESSKRELLFAEIGVQPAKAPDLLDDFFGPEPVFILDAGLWTSH